MQSSNCKTKFLTSNKLMLSLSKIIKKSKNDSVMCSKHDRCLHDQGNFFSTCVSIPSLMQRLPLHKSKKYFHQVTYNISNAEGFESTFSRCLQDESNIHIQRINKYTIHVSYLTYAKIYYCARKCCASKLYQIYSNCFKSSKI